MSPAALARRKTAMPVLAVAGLAWAFMVIRFGNPSLSPDSCCVPVFPFGTPSPESVGLVLLRNSPQMLVASWALMLVAMMTPMLANPLRHVLDRSFAQRRARSVFLFLVAYFGIWMFSGIVILSLVLMVRLLIPNPLAQVAAVGTLACVWQCSPAKQVCLNRAHALPELAAFGWAADRDALRFGFNHGDWCIGSCWAVMWFAEVCSIGHLTAMAFVTLWVLAEHLEKPTPPRWRVRLPVKAVRLLSGQVRIFVLAHKGALAQ